jgi:hypothetical protein
LSWKPEFPLPHWDKMNLPAARNAVRNTLTRSAMHGRWFLNDPDCILLRASTRLTPAELRGILTVQAMCGGPVIVSDDMKVSRKALTLVGLELSSDLRPHPRRAAPCLVGEVPQHPEGAAAAQKLPSRKRLAYGQERGMRSVCLRCAAFRTRPLRADVN